MLCLCHELMAAGEQAQLRTACCTPTLSTVCPFTPGLMLALDCKPAGAALHLYGYNWSRRHWRSHAIAAEERVIRLLVTKFSSLLLIVLGLRHAAVCEQATSSLLLRQSFAARRLVRCMEEQWTVEHISMTGKSASATMLCCAQADLGRLTIHETACNGHDEAPQGDLPSGTATNSSVPCSTAQVTMIGCMPRHPDEKSAQGMMARPYPAVSVWSIDCAVQATSQGELSTEQLLQREPEKA